MDERVHLLGTVINTGIHFMAYASALFDHQLYQGALNYSRFIIKFMGPRNKIHVELQVFVDVFNKKNSSFWEESFKFIFKFKNEVCLYESPNFVHMKIIITWVCCSRAFFDKILGTSQIITKLCSVMRIYLCPFFYHMDMFKVQLPFSECQKLHLFSFLYLSLWKTISPHSERLIQGLNNFIYF